MIEPTLDIDVLSRWIGRSETREDVIHLGPATRMHALLGRDTSAPREGDALAPMWHWAYFLETAPHAELGPDGHPRPADFMPPVSLARRMWAGGRLEIKAALKIGNAVRCVSTIANVSRKSGRSGELCFVTIRFEFFCGDILHFSEEHDIVYREEARSGDLPPPPTPPTPPTNADWSEQIDVDPVQLFCYSALTYNTHRIHYDRKYCLEIEGYEGLVVHGPLTATQLVGLARRHADGAEVKRFHFRALSPIFDTAPHRISGRRDGDRIELWATTSGGALAMTASADLD
jgi:3-methylfumaryl-CoA hydratase